MIPIRTDSPIKRTPWVNYALIAANVLIFLMSHDFAGRVGRYGGPADPLREPFRRFQVYGSEPEHGLALYQFVSYQFLHANWAHLGGNMLFLWVFGNSVNAKMGHVAYALFYLAGGVFAATGYAVTHENPMLGASGAIAAVTTAYLALFPRSYITFLFFFFYFVHFIELPSMFMIIFKMIIWDNIIAHRITAASNVAYQAHLAGYVFGFLASMGMLFVGGVPRDQFDMLALMRRWWQRRAMRGAMSDPQARARARYGRVARDPSEVVGEARPVVDAALDKITDLRSQIDEALSHQDRTQAAELYEQLTVIDPRQVLSRDSQLDVANQLYTLLRYPQATSAYEKYLQHYGRSPEADEVRLLVGIIYARDLAQYEMAERHLKEAADRLRNDRRREQCLHWLDVIDQARGQSSSSLRRRKRS